MPDQDYSEALNDLMLLVVRHNAGMVNLEKLKEEIEWFKHDLLFFGSYYSKNFQSVKALDYLDNRKTKIALLQHFCNHLYKKDHHPLWIIIESKSSKKPDKILTSVLEVNSSDTVSHVKLRIGKKNARDYLPLFFQQTRLEDDQTLKHYKIQHGSVLQYGSQTFHEDDKTLEHYKIQNGSVLQCGSQTFHECDKTLEHYKIQNGSVLQCGSQTFHEDDKILVDYKIQDGSVLQIGASTFHLFCLTNSGLVLDIEVKASDTIESVKYKIKLKVEVSVDQLILIHDGDHLEDGRILSEYSITSEETVYLLIRTAPVY